MASEDDLDFSAAEFARMPPIDRIRICRQLALRARNIAEVCDGKHRASYIKIADEWDTLAEGMEQQEL